MKYVIELSHGGRHVIDADFYQIEDDVLTLYHNGRTKIASVPLCSLVAIREDREPA